LTLVERHVKKETSHPRSLKTKAENHTVLKQGRNVRGLHKSSRSGMSSKNSKMKRVDSTQVKIENFMASSEGLG
jgi:DNA topoisomerase VI subunit B